MVKNAISVNAGAANMTLTLWYTRCPTPTAFSIAIQRGLIAGEFASEDIDIRSLAASSDPKVRQSHFDASAANFFRHGGNGPPLVSRSRGADIRVIATSWNSSYRPLLALPDSGIRSVADLKGKRISIPRRLNDKVDFWHATALRGIKHALNAGNVSFDDIIPTEVVTQRTFVQDSRPGVSKGESLWDARFMLGHQREEAFALIRGEVDAVYSQGAMAAILEGVLGAVTVTDINAEGGDPYKSNNDVPYVLTASGALIDSHPALVARLLVRVFEAADWARVNEQAAKAIIASESGIAVDLVDKAFSPSVHEQLDIDLATDKVASLKSQHDHLLSHGFIEQAVDFASFIDPQPLAAARELYARRRQQAAA